MIFLVLALGSFAIFLLWWSQRSLRSIGLPGGRIIYADTRQWGPVERPLYDATLALTGRPDYLVQQGEKYIPVEVKSSRAVQGPYDAHIFQLAAYCVLVERTYGQRPPYGILHYPNRTFAVDFTPGLEAAVLDLLAEIRRGDRRRNMDRSHSSTARCHGCGFHSLCDQSL